MLVPRRVRMKKEKEQTRIRKKFSRHADKLKIAPLQSEALELSVV